MSDEHNAALFPLLRIVTNAAPPSRSNHMLTPIEWIKRLFCRHDWLRSRYVNIATGENLGCLCTKCGKWKP